ncbi:autotransporter outer membrane beta-barrel domain-containing protein, partial [Serratia microhaemolytica]|uniref:autotransporter outer membrane beta-barrel domain-containing protein n=1 Tax=Serratia microhaemolytica TaxID=2675110 RepID=UPI000FDE96B9
GTYINNAGRLRNLSEYSADTVIETSGAAAVITNQGELHGRVQLANAVNNLFFNLSGARWDSSGGFNEFGEINSILMNDGRLITANRSAHSPQTTTFNNIGYLLNAGELTMANGQAGDVTVINGNYSGGGGTLVFDTVLGDDNSLTDKLVINGNSSGVSFVTVNNLGGSGAATLNGIELIKVTGRSEGNFLQRGRIAAGAYDYSLVRGSGDNQRNWYLSSSSALFNASARAALDRLSLSADAELDVDSYLTELQTQRAANALNSQADSVLSEMEQYLLELQTQQAAGERQLASARQQLDSYLEQLRAQQARNDAPQVSRPENGAYTANLAAANNLFITSLAQRSGETAYLDLLTGEARSTSMWLRSEGAHNRSRDSSQQLKTQANRYVIQLGGDVARWQFDQQRLRMGVMAGYGNSRSSTVAQVSGYNSKGKVDGYNLGLYATWYANAIDNSGGYLDGWVQYSWFDNTVSGQGLQSEQYDADGISAALESGYRFKLRDNPAQT